jgi:hypothetical protein
VPWLLVFEPKHLRFGGVFGIGLLTSPGEGQAVILVTLETVGGPLDRQA